MSEQCTPAAGTGPASLVADRIIGSGCLGGVALLPDR